jgi:hypothetical protein
MLSGLNGPDVDELCSANVDSQLIEYVKRITPEGSQPESFSALLDAQTLGKYVFSSVLLSHLQPLDHVDLPRSPRRNHAHAIRQYSQHSIPITTWSGSAYKRLAMIGSSFVDTAFS